MKTWTTTGSKKLRRLKKSLSNDDYFYAIIFLDISLDLRASHNSLLKRQFKNSDNIL